MPGFIGEDQVRRIKESIDLVSVMSEYTNLKKAGVNFSACCPFHQERTPSMHIYTDQGTYHCFGCGAHGDVITLIREKEHVDFNDAMELLARRAGIELVYAKGGGNQMPRGERDQLQQAVEMAAKFYERMLWESPEGRAARDYLRARKLSEAVCRRFRLGWSPGNGTLIDEARRRRVDVQLLVKTDLAVDRNGRWTDRFFERVMFPICDRFGGVVAFSGRLLPEAERAAKEAGRGVGKYVNNTDTPLYHKGNTIFNLHQARGPAREKKRLLVMEGPTDVMAADDKGFNECVAVLGTALTAEHAKQLGSVAGEGSRIILVFDGDRAGQTNSLKAVRTCLSVGVPTWVAVIPDEMDPAELLDDPANGSAGFTKVIDGARSDVDHLLRTLAPRPHELDPRALLGIADQVLDSLRPIKDAELVRLYLRDTATYLNLDQALLVKRLSGGGTDDGKAKGTAQSALPPEAQEVMHILVQNKALRQKAFDDLHLESSFFTPPWHALVDRLVIDPESDATALLSTPGLDDDPAFRAAVYGWVSTALAIDDAEKHLSDAINRLRRGRLLTEQRRLDQEIVEAERAKDFAQANRLYGERLALTRQIKELEGF